MEQETNSGEWVECVVDKRYEIQLSYPYRLRRKDTKQLVREWISRGKYAKGYICLRLNGKTCLKHRVIALQFIPNPSNLPQIDHIDGCKTNNHISNLRWCSVKDNNRNKNGHKGKQFIFVAEMPTNATPLDNYNNHQLEDIYLDRTTKKLCLFNGTRIRELEPIRPKGCSCDYYEATDVAGKHVHLSHNKLFPINELDEPMDDETKEEEDQ